jgi:hypothetical protein
MSAQRSRLRAEFHPIAPCRVGKSDRIHALALKRRVVAAVEHGLDLGVTSIVGCSVPTWLASLSAVRIDSEA